MMSLSNKKVIPSGPLGADILVVGEAPGAEEDNSGIPFAGRSGEKLWETFARYGKTRDKIRVTNVLNYRPKDNKFELAIGTLQLAEGLQELEEYIRQYPPNVIAAVGAKSLEYLTDRTGIGNHRGSILKCKFNPEVKVIPTYHPANILRNPALFYLFDFDIRRVVEDSTFREFNYLARQYFIDQKEFEHVVLSSTQLAIDIETVKKDPTQIICISFSPNPHKSYIFPWDNYAFELTRAVMENPDVSKIFHYGFCFDIEVLHLHGIQTRGRVDDTYIMSHVIDARLPHTLEFLTSVYTREPYYKSVGRGELPGDTKSWGDRVNKNDVYVYNGKDTAVDFEIFNHLTVEIDHNQRFRQTYEFELEMSHIAQRISRTGMLVDIERVELLKKALAVKWTKLQFILNTICNRSINVNSHTQVKKLIYDDFKLPSRRNYEGGLTADENALISLIGLCQGEIETKKTPDAKARWELKQEALRIILEIRGIRKKISSYLNTKLHPNGRVLSMYNASGTYTGRWSASQYVDNTGLNAQTIPRDDVPIPDNIEKEDESQIVSILKEAMLTDEREDAA